MTSQIFQRLLASTSITAIALLSAAGLAHADDPAGEKAPAIAEVVVTARKQPENLQKVPVAVTSITADQLAQQGVRETVDLQKIVPSLTVAFNSGHQENSQPTAAVFSLRGQTAGNVLLTMSQPVGVYEDSANIPHPDGLNGAFVDIQRVEVLAGPQGTLYGRNTTGGAVNIITKGADYDGEHGYVSGEVGDYNDWKVGGAVNLPIIPDVLAVRAAYQHWNRTGYGTSLVTGQHPGDDHDDDLFRLSVRFDPTDRFTSSTKVEYGRMDEVGYLQTLLGLPLPGTPAASSSAAALEAGLETHCGTTANLAGLISCGTAALKPYVSDSNIFQNYSEAHLSAKVETVHAVEDFTWRITPDMNLRSITGFHRVSDFPTLDTDDSPFQILEIYAGAGKIQPITGPAYTHAPYPEAQYNAYTQEFNLTGHAFGMADWLLGAFGSWEQGHGAQPYVGFGLVQNGLVSTTTISNGEDTDTWALFGQTNIHLMDKLKLTLGGRYTDEHVSNAAQPFTWKGGQYTCSFADAQGDPGKAALNNDPSSCYTIHQAEDSDGFSYLASLDYQLTPQTLVYVKTSRGFRGGALQYSAPGLPPVKPETATDYEIGYKQDLFEHRLRLDLAAYHTDYDNKQESVGTTLCGLTTVPAGTAVCPDTAVIPHASTLVANAATARINGFEGELIATPVTGWTVQSTLTYLDGRYEKFTSALNQDGTPVNGSGTPFLDPTWRYSIGTSYEFRIGPGNLRSALDWSWRAHNNLSVVTTSPSFSMELQRQLNAAVGLLDGRIEYAIPQSGLNIALWATNLLDKHYQTEAEFNGNLGFASGNTAPPRMFGVTFTKKFGGG